MRFVMLRDLRRFEHVCSQFVFPSRFGGGLLRIPAQLKFEGTSNLKSTLQIRANWLQIWAYELAHKSEECASNLRITSIPRPPFLESGWLHICSASDPWEKDHASHLPSVTSNFARFVQIGRQECTPKLIAYQIAQVIATTITLAIT